MLRALDSRMHRAALLLAVLSLPCAGAHAQDEKTEPDAGAAPVAGAASWLIYRHDLLNTGRADPGADALLGEKAWEYLASARVTTSPLIADGVLYVCDAATVVHAVDLATRKVLWTTPPRRSSRAEVLPEAPAVAPNDLLSPPPLDAGAQTCTYSSPAVSGGRLIAATEQGIVFAIDRATGKVTWEREMPDKVFTSMRVVDGKVLFGCLDRHLYALDESSGETLWRYEAGDIIGSTPAVTSSGRIYVAAFDRRIHVIDLATGKRLRAFDIDCRTTGPLVYAEASLFFPNDAREFVAIDVLDGSRRWNQASSRFHTQGAAYDDGRLYLHVEKWLCCFRAADGRVLWRAELENTGAVSPCVGEELVYHADGNGMLYAFDKRDGKLRWKHPVEGGSWAPPSLTDGMLWVCDGLGRVLGFK